MVNVSSLPDVGGVVFELDTQAGITQLLISVRASDLPADLKHEIRDLVFQYTNGGRDATVKRALEQKIATSGIQPSIKKTTTTTPLPPPPLIGTFRSAPVFSAPKIVSQAQPKEEAFVPPVAPEPLIKTVVPIQAAIETPSKTETTVPSEDARNTVPVPPIQTETPVAAPVPIQSLDDNQAYLNRIREIKAVVNERIGNPVHLVDIDNAVGREYMSALLDAMKKLNSGSSPAQAMQRLEAALTAVEVTLDAHDAKGTTLEATTITEAPAQEEIAPVISPVSVPLSVQPVVPAYEPVSAPSFSSEPAAAPVASAWTSVPVAKTPEVAPLPVQSVPPPVQSQSIPTAAPVATGWNTVPTTPIAAPIVHSLAEAPLPKTPDVLPLTKNVEEVPVNGDVLYTEEVNEGLEQLLLEWSIFKKSGMFGTGPRGREHPLFKKVATLQIPLLLAGRFEGATQEIKQSITDYMNGWRYEQGIIYEPGEQFEHYLRRVIRHILDLQKNKIR